MKWFKHDSNAHTDDKIQKVLMRYGAEGYALYWYCLELIASRVSPENITFELKHDAEILGYHLKIDTLRVEKIMIDMINLGLFEASGDRITCLKMAKRLDNTMSQNPQLKETLSNFKSLEADKNRLDKNRKDKDKNKDNAGKPAKRTTKPESFKLFFEAYPENKKGGRDQSAWNKAKNLKLTDLDYQAMITDLKARRELMPRWWSTYAPGICKYLDDHIWKTPIKPETDENGKGKPASSSRTEYAKNIYDFERATDF